MPFPSDNQIHNYNKHVQPALCPTPCLAAETLYPNPPMEYRAAPRADGQQPSLCDAGHRQ
jgi:hypothetical protein